MISLGEVTFTYPGEAEPAVRNLSLTFEPGNLCWVTGRLGSGCSTLLLILSGLAPRTTGGELSGSRLVNGDGAADAAPEMGAGRAGIVLSTAWTQLSGITHTVFQEVAFGPQNLGWPEERVREAVSAVLKRLELENIATRDPVTLSGGELGRVIIAGVLVMEPAILLFDEPLMELDPENAELVLEVMVDLSRERTVVVASTDADRLAPVADRVVVLSGGQVVGDGEPAAVLSSTDPAMMPLPTPARIADAAGLTGGLPLTTGELVRRVKGFAGGS